MSVKSSYSQSSVVVVPSSQLDFNLHDKAAEITKQRCSEQEASFSDGSHGDDLMTPPDILLKRSLKQAKQEVGVASEQDEGVTAALESCIRCTALARIVHGDSHWLLAKTHIQLAKAYLDLKGLPQQALGHAAKGRDILLAPGSSHDQSHDLPLEVTCQLAMAQCIIGQVYTTQGKLSKAEHALLKAKKNLSQAKQLLAASGGGSTDAVEIERALLAALGRFHLQGEKFEPARECFGKAVELTKSAISPTSSQLIPALRGLATAEAHLSLYETAEQTLQEALDITETRAPSEVVGELLQAQGRLAAVQLKAGLAGDTRAADEKFSRSVSVFSDVGSPRSLEKCLKCKEEWSLMLASQPQHRERAISMLKELLAAKKETYGEMAVEVGHTLKLLASVLLSLGRVQPARGYLEQAQAVYRCSLGDTNKETSAVTESLQSISGSATSTTGQNQIKPRFRNVV